MILDIIIGLLLLLSAFLGYKKGFIRTILSGTGWLVGVISGIVFSGLIKDFITEHTGFKETINNFVSARLSDSISESNAYQSLPKVLLGFVDDAAQSVTSATSMQITEILLGIISFAAVILTVKVIFFLVHMLFSKDKHDGVIGFMDGSAGFIFGVIRGIIIVYFLMLVLVPMLQTVIPSTSQFFVEQLDDSFVAKIMYDDNIYLALLKLVSPGTLEQ